MANRLPRCESCGLTYRTEPRSGERQKYCTRPECVLRRKRRRQREWAAERCVSDPGFAAAARERCAAANRRRRAAERARAGPELSPVFLAEVVTGLLSQLADTNDPVQLRQTMAAYGDRGRRLALELRMAPNAP
ncbi:MAG: hypothetical protein JW940_28180 [Polyangiaceae bacterium]|nr:hypothetical protein [Polyangiaceae bacterium]